MGVLITLAATTTSIAGSVCTTRSSLPRMQWYEAAECSTHFQCLLSDSSPALHVSSRSSGVSPPVSQIGVCSPHEVTVAHSFSAGLLPALAGSESCGLCLWRGGALVRLPA